jgi:hypothetical protein
MRPQLSQGPKWRFLFSPGPAQVSLLLRPATDHFVLPPAWHFTDDYVHSLE